MLKHHRLAGHALAASAVALLGIGLIGSVAAQDEDRDSPPTANEADQNTVAPQQEAGPADTTQNQRDDQAKPAPQDDNQQADDSAPDDLQFDDNVNRDDSDPPAIPSDNNVRDNRDDAVRNDVRQNNGRANVVDDGVSPSDRTFDRDDNRRKNVRRFDYDNPLQPIPEDQARASQGIGCQPCGSQRVHHNPCNGCGQGYAYNRGNGNSWNGSPQYQTRNQQPNRRVLGITISDRGDGIHVASVVPNGPAAQAGVQGGDRIVAVNGNDLPDSQAFMNELRRNSATGQTTLTIDRNGEQQEISVEPSTYAQVFGGNRARVSEVPEPPQNHLVQRDQPRTAFRPDYEEATSDKDRLDRVQQRITQLEQELVALRKEEQDLQITLDKQSGEQAEESPTPADDSNADDDADSTEPPTNRERLSPSARSQATDGNCRA